jgi:hypothetical protein
MQALFTVGTAGAVKTETLVAIPAEEGIKIIKELPWQSIPKAPAKLLFHLFLYSLGICDTRLSFERTIKEPVKMHVELVETSLHPAKTFPYTLPWEKG